MQGDGGGIEVGIELQCAALCLPAAAPVGCERGGAAGLVLVQGGRGGVWGKPEQGFLYVAGADVQLPLSAGGGDLAFELCLCARGGELQVGLRGLGVGLVAGAALQGGIARFYEDAGQGKGVLLPLALQLDLCGVWLAGAFGLQGKGEVKRRVVGAGLGQGGRLQLECAADFVVGFVVWRVACQRAVKVGRGERVRVDAGLPAVLGLVLGMGGDVTGGAGAGLPVQGWHGECAVVVFKLGLQAVQGEQVFIPSACLCVVGL